MRSSFACVLTVACLALLMAIVVGAQTGPADDKIDFETALQHHVQFFDPDHKGYITISDTYHGFRRLGFNAAVSALAAGAINTVLGPKTSGHFTTRINITNIAKAIHRSDSGVFDANGEISRERFDKFWLILDPQQKGSISKDELNAGLAKVRSPWDLTHGLPGKLEWGFLFQIGEVNGRLAKEDVWAFFDGSLFDRVAARVAHGK